MQRGSFPIVMHVHENRQLVESYLACLLEGSRPVTEFFADDIVWHLPPAHPFGGPFVGVEAVIGMMERGGKLYPWETIQTETLAAICEGDDVVIHSKLTAKTHGGTDYANDYIFRYRCCNGKIAEVWEFMDTHLMQQLGMFEESSE